MQEKRQTAETISLRRAIRFAGCTLLVAMLLTGAFPADKARGEGLQPHVSLSINPSTIDFGQLATLSWSVGYASSCTHTGDSVWSYNVTGTVNSTTVYPADHPQTVFTLTCLGNDGLYYTGQATVNVNFDPTNSADGTSISSMTGGYLVLNNDVWTFLQIGTRNSLVFRNGASAANGHFNVLKVKNGVLYGQFYPTGWMFWTGSAWSRNTTGPDPLPPPVDIDVNRYIVSGQSVTVTWTSSNATSCTGTNFDASSGTSGSVVLFPTQNTTYTIVCTNAVGSTTRYVSVTAAAPGALSPDGSHITSGSGGTLVTSAGNWTFAAQGGGDTMVNLNGASSGLQAVMLQVAQSGSLFAKTSTGTWYEWIGSTWVASPGPSPAPADCMANPSVVKTQADWDAKFDAANPNGLPDLDGNAETYAWMTHYDIRAYVSLAATFGDVKYMDRAVATIEREWHDSDWPGLYSPGVVPKGWGLSLGTAQQMLDTAMIANGMMDFVYQIFRDARFAVYRPKALEYMSRLEPILAAYEDQWVQWAVTSGIAGTYIYKTCGDHFSLCDNTAYLEHNQAAVFIRAMLLMYQVQSRMQWHGINITPNKTYLHKAEGQAIYFKSFAKLQADGGYTWSYGGARPNEPLEDVGHGAMDMSFLLWAHKLVWWEITDSVVLGLDHTINRMLDAGASTSDVSFYVDGTGTNRGDQDQSQVAVDWIDLVDIDANLLRKIANVYNAQLQSRVWSRPMLGWAEIMRKSKCVALWP
jgi:hypothetical protein